MEWRSASEWCHIESFVIVGYVLFIDLVQIRGGLEIGFIIFNILSLIMYLLLHGCLLQFPLDMVEGSAELTVALGGLLRADTLHVTVPSAMLTP